jgi:ABC-type glycerol-3-phosphate transport system substrate-binding protein
MLRRNHSMKLSPRIPALLLTALVVTACAPQTSSNSSSDKDEKDGTLRVWLFQEVGNKPKEKVVDSVVAAFEKAHDNTKVDVEYIPVETRAQRVKAAFNDPSSAPDVMEYGNTDTAGYVKDGGLLDVTEEFGDWSEAKDTDPTARTSSPWGRCPWPRSSRRTPRSPWTARCTARRSTSASAPCTTGPTSFTPSVSRSRGRWPSWR